MVVYAIMYLEQFYYYASSMPNKQVVFICKLIKIGVPQGSVTGTILFISQV